MAVDRIGGVRFVDPSTRDADVTQVEKGSNQETPVPQIRTFDASRALHGQVKLFANSSAKDAPQYDEDYIEDQIELLEDRETREQAAAALLEMGPAAAPALIEELEDDWEYGYAISDVLVRMGPAAMPALIETVNCIADIYDEDGDIFGTPAVQIGYRSVKILGDMGPAAVAAIPALIRALGIRSGNPAMCDQAATALSQIGSVAIESLIEALRNGNDLAKWNAAQALVRMGSAAFVAIPALIEALKNGDDLTKENAAVALASFGPAARDAVLALIEAAQSTNGRRGAIVHALGEIGPDARDAVPLLTEMLAGTSDHNLTMTIIAALGRIGPDAASAGSTVVQALPAIDYALDAVKVLETLESIGASAETVIPALTYLLRNPHNILEYYWYNTAPVRDAVFHALASFGSAAAPAIPALIEFGLQQWNTVVNSVEILGNLGPAAEAAIPAFIEALGAERIIYRPNDGSPPRTIWDRNVAERAATALVRIGPAAIPALIEALGNVEGEARDLAIGALILLGQDTRPALFEALRNENIEIRRGASAVLLAIDADTDTERTQ